MATTTYFGWETPDDTDLVKDGAAAIRTLGSAIDTSMSQLEGGTTGQILSKTSATDMAFTWIANDQGDITGVTAGTGISGGGTSGAVTVTNSMATAITTAGDLIKGTGSGTFDRLGIGSTSQVLTVVSGAPAWVSPAGGGKVLQVVQGTSTTATTIATTAYTDTDLSVTITPSSASSKILIMVDQTFRVYRALAQAGATFSLFRGATNICNGGNGNDNAPRIYSNATATESVVAVRQPMIFLDSPSTTSATTYKTQLKTAGSVICQHDGGQSNIIVLEIGA